MTKTPATILLLVVTLALVPLWWWLASLVLRTDLLAEPVSVPLPTIGLFLLASAAAVITSRVVGRGCWARERWASVVFGLSGLHFLALFCLVFFGWVWEYRPGRPFGLWELITSWL